MARNDITGDVIKSRAPTQQYRDNYDLIFRKNNMKKTKTSKTTKPSKPILFSATWCGPCKMLKQQLDSINLSDKVELMDVDVAHEYTREYKIRSVPALVVFYKDGNHGVYMGPENILSILKEL